MMLGDTAGKALLLPACPQVKWSDYAPIQVDTIPFYLRAEPGHPARSLLHLTDACTAASVPLPGVVRAVRSSAVFCRHIALLAARRSVLLRF